MSQDSKSNILTASSNLSNANQKLQYGWWFSPYPCKNIDIPVADKFGKSTEWAFEKRVQEHKISNTAAVSLLKKSLIGTASNQLPLVFQRNAVEQRKWKDSVQFNT